MGEVPLYCPPQRVHPSFGCHKDGYLNAKKWRACAPAHLHMLATLSRIQISVFLLLQEVAEDSFTL